MPKMDCQFGQAPVYRKALKFVLAASAAVALVSCAKYTDYDPTAGLQKEDYEALLNRKAPEQETRLDEPPIPDFEPVLAVTSLI